MRKYGLALLGLLLLATATTGCADAESNALATTVATQSTAAAKASEDAYRHQIEVLATSAVKANLAHADAITTWGNAYIAAGGRTPSTIYDDPIFGTLNDVRTANDNLVQLLGKNPASLAAVDAESKRFTDRTDLYLRQFRQAFYLKSFDLMFSLSTDQLHDMNQYEQTLLDAGILQRKQ